MDPERKAMSRFKSSIAAAGRNQITRLFWWDLKKGGVHQHPGGKRHMRTTEVELDPRDVVFGSCDSIVNLHKG